MAQSKPPPKEATTKIIRYGTRVIPPADGVCGECERRMLEVATCTVKSFVIDGRRFRRTPYGQELKGVEWAEKDRPTWPCHDCGVQIGGFHHPYCDMEECPACGGQLIGCHL